MTSSLVGAISVIAIFGGAMAGMWVAQRLPEHHLNSRTRDTVSLSAATVGTLSALVIGLMISTASNTFSARSHELRAMSSDVIRIDRNLRRYGPEADPARAKLRVAAAVKMQELFPTAGRPPVNTDTTAGLMEAAQDAILSLAPTNDRQRWLRSQALDLTANISESRWELLQQRSGSIPSAFLVMLVFWLTVVFASFGLFAPRNATAIVALLLCSLAVSGGMMLIVELDSPFLGLVHISAEPMRLTLEQLNR